MPHLKLLAIFFRYDIFWRDNPAFFKVIEEVTDQDEPKQVEEVVEQAITENIELEKFKSNDWRD